MSKKEIFKIGSHVGMSGKDMLLGSVKEAVSYGSNTFMIYTGAPQNTRRKPIDELNIEAGLKLMKVNNIDIDDIVDLLILFENEMGVETDLYTKRNVASKLIK